MRFRCSFRAISIRDLSRLTGAVVRRVEAGERLIVCRHGQPVATLQPLDGFVIQPVTGTTYDIEGSPLGDASEECRKLSQLDRDLLATAQRDLLRPMRVSPPHNFGAAVRAMENMIVRGLARKCTRGTELTGRGMMLREEICKQESLPVSPVPGVDRWRLTRESEETLGAPTGQRRGASGTRP